MEQSLAGSPPSKVIQPRAYERLLATGARGYLHQRNRILVYGNKTVVFD